MRNTKSSWPENVPRELDYQYGKKPLHEYLAYHADERPNQIALHYYGFQLTWNEWNDYSNQVANYLMSIGISKGDHVALYMQNCPQYLICHYAIQKLGGVVIPLNPMYKSSELAYLLNEAEVKGVFCGLELLPVLEKTSDDLLFIITIFYQSFIDEANLSIVPNELKIAHQSSRFTTLESIFDTEPTHFQTVRVDMDDTALLVFTSGTTGRPKAAMLSFENALYKTAATMTCNQVTQEDKLLANAPLCHIAGMVMGVNLPVYSGNETVLLSRFDPEVVVKTIEDHRITMWYSIAPMNGAIMQMPNIEQRDLSSLRLNLATSFGLQVTEELSDQWNLLTDGCLLYEASYGLSETHTCDTFMPKEHIKFGSCGIPIQETEIKIFNTQDGKELNVNEEGEIVIKSPGVFKGYYKRADATAATLVDGWVYTGDIGHLDEEGYLYFHGRVKEMIKSSGY
ncbi:MAG: AMP-binding protein, partial [Anaerobacillus sp.]